ncbi:MAG TPA: type VI secretion system tip protein TssI/VgrG [Stellaceae bacterium]|nr:type VI secretion system tip protein TssI/VgrG [Stellaceae bacterium]
MSDLSDDDDDSSSDSDSDSGTNYIKIKIEPDPGFKFDFESLEGTEELGRPFLYVLDVSAGTPKGDLTSILGSSCTVSVEGDSGKRYFNGIISRVSFSGLTGGAFRYRLELRPWIWLLSQTTNCKMFQTKSPWQIMGQIFRDAGFSDWQDKRQNSAGDKQLEYCVQYRETGFDFVTRLMEQWGLYYFYQHKDGTHVLMMSDDPNSHTSVGDAIPFDIRQTEARRVDDHIWQWSTELILLPGAYTMRDYNFTTPSDNLEAKSLNAGQHPHGSLEVYDYPGPHATTAIGQTLTSVRMQDITSRVQIRSGMSNSRKLYTGCKFTLSGFADKPQNAEHLVIKATYSFNAAEGKSETQGQLMDTFRCVFDAIPGDVPFKLATLTPKPIVRGPQTAKVVGQSGDEITTDSYGRVKVSFYWDRDSKQNETSSCWIRVAQAWAGVSWGAIFIPRIGQEVIVDFLEGNPDRPIITGSVYNASVTVPYGLPDNKTRSTIKSNSSQGGGGFNELRFEDKKGSEEVFFQAQKDYNKVVLNNETVKITQDTTTTVDKGNRSITVSQGDNSETISTGNNSLTVSKGNNSVTVSQGNNSVTVSQGNDSLTVSQGNHSITVSMGSSTVQAQQSITLQVGSNSIQISTSGITINGSMITASATGNMTLSGAMISIN